MYNLFRVQRIAGDVIRVSSRRDADVICLCYFLTRIRASEAYLTMLAVAREHYYIVC